MRYPPLRPVTLIPGGSHYRPFGPDPGSYWGISSLSPATARIRRCEYFPLAMYRPRSIDLTIAGFATDGGRGKRIRDTPYAPGAVRDCGACVGMTPPTRRSPTGGPDFRRLPGHSARPWGGTGGHDLHTRPTVARSHDPNGLWWRATGVFAQLIPTRNRGGLP